MLQEPSTKNTNSALAALQTERGKEVCVRVCVCVSQKRKSHYFIDVAIQQMIPVFTRLFIFL